MTTEEALLRLADSTSEAVAGVLATFSPDTVARDVPKIVGADADPLQGIRTPAVAASVSYVDGVTGGNVFVLTVTAARRLAAAMMGGEPSDDGDELSELELSAVSEAMNQMMAAAAGATGKVLGQEVEISVPATHMLSTDASPDDAFEKTPHATAVAFELFGEPARLVQLVPNAFVVRMSRALGELDGELAGRQDGHAGGLGDGAVLRGVSVRLWAELGRTELPIGRAVGLTPGAVLELDRSVDDPVELYVNGRRFALGRLMLADDGEWAVEIEQILGQDAPPAA